MNRLRRRQGGQTLILFALVGSFVLFALYALVGDYAQEQIHYNGIDEASVLAAKAGAAQIDITAFSLTHQPKLDTAAAARACHDVAQANAPFIRPEDITCTVTPDYVEATLVDHGELIVKLLGSQYRLSATHRSRPAYGLTQPCTTAPCS